MNYQEPKVLPGHIADDEINLVDVFLIVWKRKTMIIVLTLLLTVAATGICLIMPNVYEVDAILEPGKDAEGRPVENPQAIRQNILSGAYDQVIAEKLSFPLDKIPAFKVSVPKQTDLVKISVESSDPQQAVLILQTLLKYVSEKIQGQFEIKRNLLENKLKEALLKESFMSEKIKILESLILQAKLKAGQIDDLNKAGRTNPSDGSMANFLYLNELSGLQNKKEQILIVMSSIRLKLSSLTGAHISKVPSVSKEPIKPKKTLIIVFAVLLGLAGGIILAFFSEFMIKVRQQQQAAV